jgi:hypothetical protein
LNPNDFKKRGFSSRRSVTLYNSLQDPSMDKEQQIALMTEMVEQEKRAEDCYPNKKARMSPAM